MVKKDIKKNSLKIQNIIKKEIKKEIPKITSRKFDLWKIITQTIGSEINFTHFCVCNYDWGTNKARITNFFWQKFFKDFKGKIVATELHSRKFKENLYNLLNSSINQTPQKTDKERVFPFKQQTKYGKIYALPGYETTYSNKHNSNNYYHYNYCNKTKVKFFKGPLDQAKKIIENNWQNIFSEAFIYGYISAAVKIICDLGSFELKKIEPKDDLSDYKAVFKKNIFTKLIYSSRYIKNITTEFYQQFYAISKNESTQLFNNVENSIFNSKLSHFLFLKNENYFVYNCKELLSDESDGIGDFISELQKGREKYLVNSKEKRFKEVVLNTGKNKRIAPSSFDDSGGCILNYEQFRLYTLSLPYLNPYTEKQLNINERDIFIRYAVNLGVQEILFYSIQKIFSKWR